MQPARSRSDKSPMNQGESQPSSSHRPSSRRRGIHRCPHCPKQYITATWLEIHLKAKHSMLEGGELVDEGRNRRVFVESAAQRSPSLQESYSSALVNDLRSMSFRLRQVISLIDDVVPLLQAFEESSSRSFSTGRSHLQNLKRRASSPDLRGGQGMKRKGIPMYSSGVQSPQASESIRGTESRTRTRNNSPITTFVDDQRLTTNAFDYSPSVPGHIISRHSQEPRLLRPQDTAACRQILNSELPQQQQLQTTSFLSPEFRDQADTATPFEQATEYQHTFPSIGRESIWISLATMTPVIDAQPSQLLQEPNQQQLMMQTLRHISGSSVFGFPDINDLDSIFRGLGVPNPLVADSAHESNSPGQLVGNSKGGDDLPFDIFDT